MSNTMDYDAFVDKLEELCDCEGQGYIKCLEHVKQLKAENEELKEEHQDLLEDIESHPDYDDHWDMKNEEYNNVVSGKDRNTSVNNSVF